MLEPAGGSTSAPDGEAAIPASPSPSVVHLACRCPEHPHEFDVVTLLPEASNRMGIAVAASGQRATNEVDAEVDLGMIFLRYGIAAWTFTDADGPVELPDTRPIPEALIERWLPWTRGGYTVAQAANNLYAEDVFRPFLELLQTRSPDGRAARLTSASKGSGPKSRTRSKRSSRTSSAGKPSEVRGR